MATLFLTCGLQGSGKTTLAQQLEAKHHALRLIADEWLHELHPGVFGTELDALRKPVERIQWRTAARALELGCNVVLDWGLWAKEERDYYREQARAFGASVVLLVLDPPRDEVIRRLATRNASLPDGTFRVNETDLARGLEYSEPPTSEELALFDSLNAS